MRSPRSTWANPSASWTAGAAPAEVKNSRTWRAEYAKTLNEFLAAGHVDRGFVVHRGTERYKTGGVEGLPVEDFLALLYTESFHGDGPRR